MAMFDEAIEYAKKYLVTESKHLNTLLTKYNIHHNKRKEYGVKSPSREVFYRYEYDGEGIYDALKYNISMEEWKSLLKSSAFTWLPKPNIEYYSGYKSYFTNLGNEMFIKKTLPICKKYLDIDKINFIKNKDIKNIIYRDEFQVVVKEKMI